MFSKFQMLLGASSVRNTLAFGFFLLCGSVSGQLTLFLLLSTGRFYYLIHPTKLTYDEAVQACLNDGAQIAKVGQIFAAWKLLGYDRCDAGWLADGSVRYPISRPRRRCSPTEAAVRFVGFPDKKHKLYGVYCFRAYNWVRPRKRWFSSQRELVKGFLFLFLIWTHASYQNCDNPFSLTVKSCFHEGQFIHLFCKAISQCIL